MVKRVEMINCVTGTTMLVPAQLVEMYVKAGHRMVANEAPAPAKKQEQKEKVR